MTGFGKDGRGQVLIENSVHALGALGALDVVSFNSKIDSARERGFRVTKMQICSSFSAKTAAEGGIMFGLAVELSAAEIEECIEADPQSPNDVPDAEEAMRPVFPLGQAGQAQTSNVLNNGNFYEINLNWSIPEGAGLDWWYYNMSSGALTTGTTFRHWTKVFGVWLND